MYELLISGAKILCCYLPAGLSMFFWCWVSIEGNLIEFTLITLFLYYLLHFILWMFSLVVLLMVCFLLQGHLAASSETRKFVLKQNTIYVLVLGIETGIIISLWLTQLSILYIRDPDNDTHPIFHSEVDYGLAIVFAVVHSLRGTVDLVVWWVTFSIGPKDLRWLYQHLKLKWKRKRHYLSPDTLNTPLIQANTSVNRALRRDAIYCINIGILDAVRLSAENERDKLGSVRDPFVAQMMVHLDDENQEHATAQLREENPQYRELSERKITFPPTGSIQHFAFIDLEPSIFSLLRSSYGVVPTVYRQSFKIKNAADVESSGMLEKFTEGKSGSFFYFTRDFQYIIKTVTSSEERFLQKIAYRYYRHMRSHPDSLIVRLYGLHKVRLAREQRYITVVVMDNIFRNNDLLKVTERYDLKGSTVGRRVLKGNRERATYKGTLKDLDLDKRIVVGAESKTHLMEQLRQDVDFLASCKIMDYSMLLGIHHHSNAESSLGPRMRSHSIEVVGGEDFIDVNPVDLKRSQEVTPVAGGASNVFEHRPSTSPRRPHSHRISVLPSHNIDSASINETGEYSEPYVPWFRRDFGGLRSYSPFHPCVNMERERGQTVLVEDYNGLDAHSIPVDTYFFGIVDILQEYNWEKKVEHFWKTSIMCKDKHGISAVNEKEYGERFLNAIDRIFE